MEVSLGKVTVTTPGTPVRATVNLSDPTANYFVHAYCVQRREASVGKIYVSLSSTDDRVNETQVLAELTKTSPARGAGITSAPNALNLNRVWIDSDEPGDSVIITALVN